MTEARLTKQIISNQPNGKILRLNRPIWHTSDDDDEKRILYVYIFFVPVVKFRMEVKINL